MSLLEFLNMPGRVKDVTISLYGSQCLCLCFHLCLRFLLVIPCLLSSHPSDHMRERSQVSTTAPNVTHWKGHLLSCSRQLRRHKSRESNHQLTNFIIKNPNSLSKKLFSMTLERCNGKDDHDIMMVMVKPQPREAPCSSPSARPGTASTKAPPYLLCFKVTFNCTFPPLF